VVAESAAALGGLDGLVLNVGIGLGRGMAGTTAAVQVQVDAARRFLRCEHAQRDLAGPAGDEQFACPGQEDRGRDRAAASRAAALDSQTGTDSTGGAAASRCSKLALNARSSAIAAASRTAEPARTPATAFPS